MKFTKIIKTVSILLLTLLIMGCASPEDVDQGQTQINDESESTIEISQETTGGPCDNIFYPLGLNNQWIYRLDAYMDNYEDQALESSGSNLSLTVSEVGASSVMLAALDQSTGVVTQTNVQCVDQAIVNFPLTELNMIFGDMAGEINVEYLSGTFMPSQKEFEDSNWSLSWETEYKASGTVEASYDGEDMSAVLEESPVIMRWQVTNTGVTLEVAAGTFNDLVKINREISFDITSLKTYVEGNQIDIKTTLTLDTDMYYAPNIGLIKQEVNAAAIKLYGISFPIDAWGFVELSSYTVN